MYNLDKLSNQQLISLFKSYNIDSELKSKIINEIDKRDLEKIEINYDSLSNKKKVFIVLTSYFLFKYHLKKSNELLIQGNKTAYKQYWRYFNLGVIFKFIILLLLSKYIFRIFIK